MGENLETKVRAQCNECGGERNHSILHSEKTSWSSDEDGTSGSDTYDMLRCLGCDNIKLLHTSRFSEDGSPTINYFPPAIFRKQPEWLNELFANVAATEEAFVYALLLEIYSALQNNQPHLAAMGIRSLLERIMIAKVGDRGTFSNNISEFEAKGFVSHIQRERLETILEAGHATIHRSFTPSHTDLITLVNITESIVETVFLHEEQVARLRKRVPTRSKK
jgi:hypothetical protein